MRLLCEYSDGTTVSLETAIQRDPYRVRGLVNEAFFHCLASLHDTDPFLRAERAVRDALVNFNGSEDRYIKPYITSRYLDSRTKITPRAGVIQSSFSIGGPLALVGAFHATSNTSRNMSNRETLDYLQDCCIESRDNLFARAHKFPHHPSITSWFQQIIEKLDIDAQNLAYFLTCLGPHESSIPDVLFTRARKPSCTWDQNGEIMTHPRDITPVLSDESRFNSAVQTLRLIGYLRPGTSIHVDQQLATLIATHIELVQWRIMATRVICYTFPKHESIEPNSYAEVCKLLLPYLQRTLIYPFDGIEYFQTSYMFQAIESCLSSLEFSELDWNSRAISYAETLLSLFKGREQKDFEILEARVAVAKARIKRCSERVIGPGEKLDIVFPNDNDRSRAFSAELALLRAEVQIDLNNYDQALAEVSQFEALSSSTSSLGRITKDRISLNRGAILRIRGQFSDAYEVLSSLPHTGKAILQFSAVLCERGEYTEAIHYLQQAAAHEKSPLAWANAHLCKYMHAAKQGRQDEESFQIATNTFHSIRLGKERAQFDSTFSTLVGQGILFHIQGAIEPARKAWFDALNTLQSYGLPPGYLDVLLLAALSDLSFREHGTEASRLHRHEAGVLLARHPPNHRFVGIGSYWLEILSSRPSQSSDMDYTPG